GLHRLGSLGHERFRPSRGLPAGCRKSRRQLARHGLVKFLLKPSSLFLLLLAVGPPPLAAQDTPVAHAPLEEFVQRVAGFWSAADVTSLVQLIPENGRLTL